MKGASQIARRRIHCHKSRRSVSILRTALLLQVCLEYSEHVGKAGLTEEGLRAMYESGNGNVDDDYEALGFMVDEDNPEQACLFLCLC